MSKARERAKTATIAGSQGASPENVPSRLRLRPKEKGKADNRLCYGCGKRDIYLETVQIHTKEKGKRVRVQKHHIPVAKAHGSP